LKSEYKKQLKMIRTIYHEIDKEFYNNCKQQVSSV
jgi:hypothetical protein